MVLQQLFPCDLSKGHPTLIATVFLAEEQMLLLTMLSSRCSTDAVLEDYLRRWGQKHVDLTGRNRRIVNSENFY
jgi:hypothetical protein